MSFTDKLGDHFQRTTTGALSRGNKKKKSLHICQMLEKNGIRVYTVGEILNEVGIDS